MGKQRYREADSLNIDVHNHFYPESYLRALRTGRYSATLTQGDGPDPILEYSGDYNILVPGHRDLDARVEDMDAAGMDAHVLSLTTPGVHIEDPSAGAELARAVNEDFSAICREHAGRFYAFAALPLQDPRAAADELEHAVIDLGLHGATLFTNVAGRSLDHPAFEPLFETADRLRAPLFVHPTSPHDYGALADYRLVPLLGFLFDTTTTVARLVFAGVPERHPNLVFIASHLGGTLPYVAERLDRGFEVYPEIRELIPRRPSEYIGRMYYDTVSFDPEAVGFALRSQGLEHLVLGSDYPHQIGDMRKALDTVHRLHLPEEESARILGGNIDLLIQDIEA